MQHTAIILHSTYLLHFRYRFVVKKHSFRKKFHNTTTEMFRNIYLTKTALSFFSISVTISPRVLSGREKNALYGVTVQIFIAEKQLCRTFTISKWAMFYSQLEHTNCFTTTVYRLRIKTASCLIVFYCLMHFISVLKARYNVRFS